MIVEEATVQTLSGKKISWKLAIGPSSKKPQKIVDSKRVDGEIYASLADINQIMETKLYSFLKSLINQASKREEAWYGSQVRAIKGESETAESQEESNLVAPVPPADSKIDPEQLLAEVESHDDVPEVDVMPLQQEEHAAAAPASEEQSAKDRLRSMVTPSQEELAADGIPDVPKATIEGPGGTRIPVNLKV